MSSGLMSCVRENSPPLELDEATEAASSGPFSLPMQHHQYTSSGNSNVVDAMGCGDKSSAMSSPKAESLGGAVQSTEQQKRRRFHPLRNLRRIFRRRTITSVTDAPAAAAAAAGHTNTLPAPRVGGGGGGGVGGAQQSALSSNSEKNLRSTTLASMSSVTTSASSPSSPLTHQQLQEAYNSQSLPKSKTYATGSQLQRDVLLLGSGGNRNSGIRGKLHQTLQHDSNGESSTDFDITTTTTGGQQVSGDMFAATTAATNSLSYQRMSQSIGVAVLPPLGGGSRGRSFLTERQKLRSIGDSSHDLDSSENDSGPSGVRRLEGRGTMHNSSSNSGEITDSQRSLSEGRLVDSDFTREGLSQSHDSVFSESATASSLSIVLRAELADVLRKRRTRPDGSDEDLGLPRSPGSPQRRAEQIGHNRKPNKNFTTSSTNNQNNANQSEVSSVSLLSMTSNECDDFQATSTANNSIEQHTERTATTATTTTTSSSRYTRSATFSSMPAEILRHPTMSASFSESTKDEVDLFSSDWQRLSHSAAKHKMAIRPPKKNVPTRQNRRTLENSIPEANEDSKATINTQRLEKISNAEAKTKSRSLPPGVNAKILEQNAAPVATAATISQPDKKTSTASSITITNKTADLVATTSKPSLLSETCTSSTKISSSNQTTNSKMFGIRAFASSKTSKVEQDSKQEDFTRITTTTTTAESASTTMETSNNESGFLRRLMQRNSKRNYAKANAADELDKNVVSEPKKIPISTSCFEMNSSTRMDNTGHIEYRSNTTAPLDKAKSAMSYGQSVEEARKGIKREIINEGKNGLSAILNNFMLPTSERTSQPQPQPQAQAQPTTNGRQEQIVKPKSGPAARQRYLPQDVVSQGEEIEAVPQNEVLQSTTIIRDITAATQMKMNASSPIKKTPHRGGVDTVGQHHHYEKKPKIVGLSAFQQKISRSNDSVVHLSHSTNSLETSTDDDLMLQLDQQAKQRKAVEKSRSFRTYNEDQRESSNIGNGVSVSTRNNMPSLPDLTLNLRVPNYTQHFILQEKKEYSSPSPPEPQDSNKCSSLGFEINDNTLLRRSGGNNIRSSDSAGNLTSGGGGGGGGGSANNKCNFIVTTTTTSSPNRLLAPNTVLPHLSPSSSCQVNISEIEQNIDMIVKSPFVSVIRKSANLDEEELDDFSIANNHKEEVVVKSVKPEKFNSKTTINARNTATSTITSTESSPRPTTLALKEKTKSQEQLTDITPTTAAVPLRSIQKGSNEAINRMSNNGGYNNVAGGVVGGPTKSTPESKQKTKENDRKSAPVASAMNNNLKMTRRCSSVNEEAQDAQQQTPTHHNVPEFMKIQLNHIDQARFMGKSNVVLAKNVKESTATSKVSSPVTDATPRRLSDEVVIIRERSTAAEETKQVVEKVQNDLPPKSPTKKLQSLVSSPTTDNAPSVELRSKAENPSPTLSHEQGAANNKLSLQERKRLFMVQAADKLKNDKKIEEIRNERKKSMSEEVKRKLSTCGRLDERNENDVKATTAPSSPTTQTSAASPTATTPSTPTTPVLASIANSTGSLGSPTQINEPNVILRKKSFGISSSSITNNTNINNGNHKDDPTPELMKVFARRSLKVKDEDITALSDKLQSTTNSSNSKKTTSTTNSSQNVDSDKENQSSSEEKLHKLSVNLEQMTSVTKITNHNLHISSSSTINQQTNASHQNRNSVADFRNGGILATTPKTGHHISNNTNNNNNNNIANSNNSHHNHQLPPIKVSNSLRSSISNSGLVGSLTNKSINGHSLETSSANNQQSTNNHHQPQSSNNSNNFNNNLNNNLNTKRAYERQSLNIKSLGSTTIETMAPVVAAMPSKNIERSATIGEFKGIHQRRAEWEQRAKEALK